MISHELANEGFVKYYPFNLETKTRKQLLDTLPINDNGVYILRDNHKFGRYWGESDIVYIGCAPKQSLKKRISLYFRGHETQRTNKRIHDKLEFIKSLEISWQTCRGEDAEAIEDKILRLYEATHQELPPFNEQRSRY